MDAIIASGIAYSCLSKIKLSLWGERYMSLFEICFTPMVSLGKKSKKL